MIRNPLEPEIGLAFSYSRAKESSQLPYEEFTGFSDPKTPHSRLVFDRESESFSLEPLVHKANRSTEAEISNAVEISNTSISRTFDIENLYSNQTGGSLEIQSPSTNQKCSKEDEIDLVQIPSISTSTHVISFPVDQTQAHYVRLKLTKLEKILEAVSYLSPAIISSLSMANTKIPVNDKTSENQLSIDNALISSFTSMSLCLIGFFIGKKIRKRIDEIHVDQTPEYQYCKDIKPYIAMSSIVGLSAGLLTGFSQQKSNSRESILPGAILSTGVSFIIGSIDYIYHHTKNQLMKDQSKPNNALTGIMSIRSLSTQRNSQQNS